MLTLILLVVLGGGAGLLAVSLSDHRAPWAALSGRRGGASLRAPAVQDTSPVTGANDLDGHRGSPAPDTGSADPSRAPGRATRRYQRVGLPPKSRTAVEGPYAAVAAAPWWRRLVSLALLLGLLVAVSVGVALLLGAVFATIGALLDGAIG